MEEKIIDLSKILEKLLNGGCGKKTSTGYNGMFSIKNHGYLLDPEELYVWLLALHNGSSHDDQICSDLHQWNIEMIHD